MSAPRHLAAVWFADLVGYSRLAAEDERTALQLLRLFQGAARQEIEAAGGHLVKFVGDAVFAEFTSVEAAVRSALALLRECAIRGERAGLPLALRIGVHIGDVIASEDGDLYGDGVNIAARLQVEAEPGQVLVSEDVWRQLRARREYSFTALGERELKGIPARVAVFGVAADPYVEEIEPARGDPDDDGAVRRRPSPAGDPKPRPRGRVLAVSVLLTVLVASGILAYSRHGGPDAEPAAGPSAVRSDPLTLAVLPFKNLSDSREDEYFAEGVATEILNTLASVPDLRVMGQTSSFAFKEKDLPLAEIAHQLHVRFLLEGTVRREEDRVRIHARLVDATSGFQLWAEVYDRQVAGMIAVQTQIASSIAAALRVRLGVDTDSLRRSRNPEAYDLYLRGVYEFRKRNEDAAAVRRAIANFQDAIIHDPAFALAHAGLARAQVVASTYLAEYSAETSRRDASLSARTALALDSTLSEARSALAYAVWTLDRDYAGGEREFRRAIQSNPNDPTAHQWFGGLLRYLGRVDEAIRAGEEAIALDPFASLPYSHVGLSYALGGRLAEAEAAFVRRPVDAGLPPNTGDLAYRVYAPQGRIAEARAVLEGTGLYSAYVEAVAGRHAEARRLATAVIAAEPMGSVPTATFVHLALGDRENAFAFLDRWAALPALHHNESPFDARLAPLHDDPRWDAFLRRMKLPPPLPR